MRSVACAKHDTWCTLEKEWITFNTDVMEGTIKKNGTNKESVFRGDNSLRGFNISIDICNVLNVHSM